MKNNKREPVIENPSAVEGDWCYARYQGVASGWFMGQIEQVHHDEGKQVAFVDIMYDADVHCDDGKMYHDFESMVPIDRVCFLVDATTKKTKGSRRGASKSMKRSLVGAALSDDLATGANTSKKSKSNNVYT